MQQGDITNVGPWQRPMNRRLFVLGTLAVASRAGAVSVADRPASVAVIPTMHRRMADSASYTYADLYALVRRFKPDHVGVEIRAEDLGRDRDYLLRFYPVEMVTLAGEYGSSAFGFDWLGSELVGRSIPDDWFQSISPIKRLERAWNDDALSSDARGRSLSRRLQGLSERQDHNLQNATAQSLADGRYDAITARYYETMFKLTAGTEFAALPAWYRQRDNEISRNILHAIEARPGARVAVVTGADHHGPVVRMLSRHPLAAQVVAYP